MNAIPSNYVSVSGTKTIESNGTHDVKSWENADVKIPAVCVAETVFDLPDDAPVGSLAIVLRGE